MNGEEALGEGKKVTVREGGLVGWRVRRKRQGG